MREIKARIGGAEQVHQFVVDNLHDLLSRLDTLHNFLAEGLAFDPVDKIADHLEIDIGIEQRESNLAQRFADVLFGNLPQPAQVSERILELAADCIEHEATITGVAGRLKGILGPR